VLLSKKGHTPVSHSPLCIGLPVAMSNVHKVPKLTWFYFSPPPLIALLLEVSRLNSENREREEQIKQVHETYEKRVRDLETSGEDMEQHYGKLLDEKKQEVGDLKLHVEALEKQMKAKKQFLEVKFLNLS